MLFSFSTRSDFDRFRDDMVRRKNMSLLENRLDVEIERYMDETEPPPPTPETTINGWQMRSHHTFMEEDS